MPLTMLALLLLAACPAPAAHDEVTLSACDTTARLHRGQTLVVRLESQITTGYAWSVVPPLPGCVAAVGEPEIERRDGDVDGGREVQVFRFRADSTGSGILTFHNRRSWEKDKAPLKTCTIKVEAVD